MEADNTAICLFSIWFGNRGSSCSSCPCSCLYLLSCCISNQQGKICWAHYSFMSAICFELLLKFYCLFIFFVHFQLLDYLLGHGHVALFRRAELKTLVNMHGNEVCMTALIFYNFKLKENTPPPLFNLFSPSFFFHHWAHIFFSPSNALHFFHVLILLVTQSLCCTCYVSPLLKCPSDSSDPILVMHINLFSPILPAPFHLYCLLNNHVWMV